MSILHLSKALLLGLLAASIRNDVAGAHRRTHDVRAPSQRAEPSFESMERIVGGSQATPREFPFAGLLTVSYKGSTFLCGSSLITPRYVITAGHCVTQEKRTVSSGDVAIGLGANDVDSLDSYRVSKITVHPDYDPSTVSNDVALLRLRTAISLNDNLNTVTISSANLTDEEVFTAIGWGKTSSNGTVSDTLRRVNVTSGPADDCQMVNPDFSSENGTQICTARNRGRDTCQGDSGGPLLYPDSNGTYQLAGITSYGYTPNSESAECGTDSVVAFYTHVNYYTNWISDVTGVSVERLTGKTDGDYGDDDTEDNGNNDDSNDQSSGASDTAVAMPWPMLALTAPVAVLMIYRH
ncbi:hypothetical protein H4R34_002604 [Dimargaris verticillata]|uniref:Peptidase S1 domain-containing protein n=1 Tax=Dimargaris verticillata TaxID=2761393 RepID=A0A9W8B3L5_9FUNG|nr:hypothetical protein H4R34_002604 [Dimargaris verticillata]